jgi:hypothetical protein
MGKMQKRGVGIADFFGDEIVTLCFHNGFVMQNPLSYYVLLPRDYDLLNILVKSPQPIITERALEYLAPAEVETEAQYNQWFMDPGPRGMRVFHKCVQLVHYHLYCMEYVKGFMYYGTLRMRDCSLEAIFDDEQCTKGMEFARLLLLLKKAAVKYTRAEDTNKMTEVIGVESFHVYYREALVLYRLKRDYKLWIHDTYPNAQARVMYNKIRSRRSGYASCQTLFQRFTKSLEGTVAHGIVTKWRPQRIAQFLARYYLHSFTKDRRCTGLLFI